MSRQESAHDVVVPAIEQVQQSDVAPSRDALTDQTNYMPRRKIIEVFLACATVSTVGLLDETMLAVAMNVISSELHAGSQISWVAGAYFVTSTAFQMLYGRLTDIWSRKTVLYALMFVFFVGNLASSLANTFIQLLVFRAITGIAGGGMPTVAQVIVSDVVPLLERGKYQGILGISVAFANGVGPVIGGAFAQEASWRWIFRLLLPLTALSTLCVWWLMPLKKTEGNWKDKITKTDFLGSLLILSGTTLIVLALTWAGPSYPWDSAHVLASLIVGCFMSCIFVLWEWKGPKYPLLRLSIFRKRIVIGAAVTQFINGCLTIVQVFYLPTFYQLAYGYSPTKSGALLLPLTVVQTLMSTASGLIITWTGRYRELILCGWALWSIGLGLLATLDASSSLGKQIGYSVLTGLGVGQTLQPSLVALQGALERKDMAIVTGMRSFARNLGGTIGLAVTGTIINNVLRSRLLKLNLSDEEADAIVNDPTNARSMLDSDILGEVIEGYRRGFRIVFIILASLAAFSFLFAWIFLTHRDLKRDDDEELKAEGKLFVEKLEAKKRRESSSREDDTKAVEAADMGYLGTKEDALDM